MAVDRVLDRQRLPVVAPRKAAADSPQRRRPPGRVTGAAEVDLFEARPHLVVGQVGEDALDLEGAATQDVSVSLTVVEALQGTLEALVADVPADVEVEEATVAGERAVGREDRPVGLVARRATQAPHQLHAARVFGRSTGERGARRVQHEPLGEVQVTFGDLVEVPVPVRVVPAEPQRVEVGARVVWAVRHRELDRARQRRRRDAVVVGVRRRRRVAALQPGVRDHRVPEEGSVGRIERGAAAPLPPPPDHHLEVEAVRGDAVHRRRPRDRRPVGVDVPDAEDVVERRASGSAARQPRGAVLHRGTVAACAGGARRDHELRGRRLRLLRVDPAVAVAVDGLEYLRAHLDREHLDYACAVVVRRVPAQAGVLVEVGATPGVAVGQVVAGRAAGVVVLGDLRRGAVRHRACEARDVVVEDAVPRPELAEVEVAPELVGQERVSLEQVGRAPGEARIGRVDRADPRVLDRTTGCVHRRRTGTDEIWAFAELGAGDTCRQQQGQQLTGSRLGAVTRLDSATSPPS